MWLMTTEQDLINLDFVVSIHVRDDTLRFFRAGTPDAGSAARPDRDLIGTLECDSSAAAFQRLDELKNHLNTQV